MLTVCLFDPVMLSNNIYNYLLFHEQFIDSFCSMSEMFCSELQNIFIIDFLSNGLLTLRSSDSKATWDNSWSGSCFYSSFFSLLVNCLHAYTVCMSTCIYCVHVEQVWQIIFFFRAIHYKLSQVITVDCMKRLLVLAHMHFLLSP